MAKLSKNETGNDKTRTCMGGRSFNGKRDEHVIGKMPDIFCYRCKTRMGCSWCCERPRELLCLECHDWATKTALKYHGPIVHRERLAEQAKKIVDGV